MAHNKNHILSLIPRFTRNALLIEKPKPCTKNAPFIIIDIMTYNVLLDEVLHTRAAVLNQFTELVRPQTQAVA